MVSVNFFTSVYSKILHSINYIQIPSKHNHYYSIRLLFWVKFSEEKLWRLLHKLADLDDGKSVALLEVATDLGV